MLRRNDLRRHRRLLGGQRLRRIEGGYRHLRLRRDDEWFLARRWDGDLLDCWRLLHRWLRWLLGWDNLRRHRRLLGGQRLRRIEGGYRHLRLRREDDGWFLARRRDGNLLDCRLLLHRRLRWLLGWDNLRRHRRLLGSQRLRRIEGGYRHLRLWREDDGRFLGRGRHGDRLRRQLLRG